MPIYDPSGRPLSPGQLVGSKKLSDFPALNKAEFSEVCRQIEEGLSAGIPDHVPVTIPTGILARILQTVITGVAEGDQVLPETVASTVAPPDEAEEYLTPMPGPEAIRERALAEMLARTAGTAHAEVKSES